MPNLHLPVQSGSDKILKAMNRGHSGAQYRALVEKIIKARPDISLSSDLIVGFPGETDADFEETYNLARDIGFVQTYSFKFSARPGTPAAAMDAQVEDHVMGERLDRLQALLAENTLRFNRETVGKTLPVLFDRVGKQPGQMVGRSPHMQPVVVEATPEIMHQIAEVEIRQGSAGSLGGVLINAGNKERFYA